MSNNLLTVISVCLLATLMGIAARADDGDLINVTTALRNIDTNLQTIRDKGLGTFLGDAVRGKLPDAFGAVSPAAERAVKAGGHVYDIQSRGMDVISSGIHSFGTNAAAEAEYQAKDKDFQGWLGGEKLRDMTKDLLPEQARAIVEQVESFSDNVNWTIDKMERGADAIKARVQSYFSDDSGYGLEPGGTDQRVVSAAVPRGEGLGAPDLAKYDLNDIVAQQQEDTSSAIPSPIPSASAASEHVGQADNGEAASESVHSTRRGAFADDIADLERDSPGEKHRSSGGAFDEDIADLAADLGVDTQKRAGGKTDWAKEASEAEAESQAWERKEAEKQRLAAIRRQREEMARRQEEQRVAAVQAAEREAAADRRRQETLAQASEPAASGGGFGSFMADVLVGAGKIYAQQKYGIAPSGSSASRSSASDRSSGAYSVGQGSGPLDSQCPGAEARQQQIVNDVNARLSSAAGSICNSARLLEDMYRRVVSIYASCPQTSDIAAARQQAEEERGKAAQTARQNCAN